MGSRVTRKGQVTIPKRVRDHLGIEPGSVVEFEVMPDGRIVLVKQGAPPEPSRFEKIRGTAPTKLTTTSSWPCCAATTDVPLVDTNVMFDLVTDDRIWADWSARQLRILSAQETLIVNPVVYAELSVGYDRIDEVDAALDAAGIELVEIPRAALFLAGKAFQNYRARGGAKTGVLPDFFIGAHAAVQGIGLLTRDARRYRTYFPTITLITPGDA